MEREIERSMRFQFAYVLDESEWPPRCGCFLSQLRIFAAGFLTSSEYRVYAALVLDAGPSKGWKSTGCMPRDAPPRTV